MPTSPKLPKPNTKPAPKPQNTAATPVDKRQVQGAPALPAAVAKQYGLHEHAADHQLPVTKASAQLDTLLRDEATDAAVDDIAATDGDALLAAEDAAAAPVDQPKRGFWRRIGHFFAAWWGNKWARWITILVLLAGITATIAIPTARYYVLNTAGVRSSASVVALDSTTRLPLKNVKVTINGQTAKTNLEGVATLKGLELGPTMLHIKRVAFAPYDVGITIGWGSNPLGEYRMQATGVQYTVMVTDYLSGKPLANVEGVSDQANALSDKAGKMVITVEDTEQTTLPVTINKQGYRSEELTLDAENETPAAVALAPGQKHVFVDRQNNRYDIYAMDIDGKNKQVLLPATGNETSNISIAADRNYDMVAVVSTRDGLRDKDGFLMSSLTLVDAKTGTSQSIDHGAQVQIVGWMGHRLVYRIGAAGASAANAQRYRLVSYNTETAGKLQLTSANQFTASQTIGDYVYYAASANDPKATMGLFRIKPDGTGKERVFNGEVWTAYRQAYQSLLLQTPDEWYAYELANKTAAKASAPSVFGVRAYLNDSQDKTSLWIDEKQGITNLMLHDIAKGKDKRLIAQDGITGPLRWMDNTAIIYRVSNATETADYAISPQGGKAHKIADVTVSYGTISE